MEFHAFLLLPSPFAAVFGLHEHYSRSATLIKIYRRDRFQYIFSTTPCHLVADGNINLFRCYSNVW